MTLKIPTDLARQLETDAYRLAALIGLIDVVHEAASSGDALAADGLSTLIEVVAEMARRHAATVDDIFRGAPK